LGQTRATEFQRCLFGFVQSCTLSLERAQVVHAMSSLAFSSLMPVGASAHPRAFGGRTAQRSSPAPSPHRTGIIASAALVAMLAAGSVSRHRRRSPSVGNRGRAGRAARQFSTSAFDSSAVSMSALTVQVPLQTQGLLLQTSCATLGGSTFDPVGLRPVERSACLWGSVDIPSPTGAHLRCAESARLGMVSACMRSCTEATQAIEHLEGRIAEKLGLEPLLESGDLPQIIADVSHDMYGDIVAGKTGPIDIFSDVVMDVLRDIASPF